MDGNEPQYRLVEVTPLGGQTDEPSHIEIGTIESIVGLLVLVFGIGVAWATLKTSVNQIERSLREDIRPDLKDMRERFGAVEDRVDALWKDKYAPARSPRQLNETGRIILHSSGIKEVIDEHRSELLELVKEEEPKTAYDAEIAIEDVMEDLPEHFPEVVDTLKDGAFKSGAEMSAVLFVGSIYLRDQILKELGFSPDDLDRTTDKKSAEK